MTLATLAAFTALVGFPTTSFADDAAVKTTTVTTVKVKWTCTIVSAYWKQTGVAKGPKPPKGTPIGTCTATSACTDNGNPPDTFSQTTIKKNMTKAGCGGLIGKIYYIGMGPTSWLFDPLEWITDADAMTNVTGDTLTGTTYTDSTGTTWPVVDVPQNSNVADYTAVPSPKGPVDYTAGGTNDIAIYEGSAPEPQN